MGNQRGNAKLLIILGIPVVIGVVVYGIVKYWNTGDVVGDHRRALLQAKTVAQTTAFDINDYAPKDWYSSFASHVNGWTLEDGHIYNSFGGRVTLTPVKGTPYDMVISSAEIPQSYCRELISQVFPFVQAIGLGESHSNIKPASYDESASVRIDRACQSGDSMTVNFLLSTAG